MKARPILMSSPMIRALLDGRKTQTRRIVKGIALDWLDGANFTPEFVANAENGLCPFGQPGDLLWVRESFRQLGRWISTEDETGERDHRWWGQNSYQFMADGVPPELGRDAVCWRSFPSIHTPRKLSRLTLELTEVSVEQLHDISEHDSWAEGIGPAWGLSLIHI